MGIIELGDLAFGPEYADDEAEAARVNEELKAAEGGRVRIAGRIMTMRLMGKAAFAPLSDGLSRLQIYVRKKV